MVKNVVVFALVLGGCSGASLGLSGLGPPAPDGDGSVEPSGGRDGGSVPLLDASPFVDAGGDDGGAVPAPLDAAIDSPSVLVDAAPPRHDAESENDAAVDAFSPHDGGPDSPLVIFLTTAIYDGKLGGLSGADAICQTEANQSALKGAFRAWLSDGVASPETRFTRPTAGYALVNGATVAASWSELVTTGPRVALNVTGAGAYVFGTETHYVWTGTAADGTAAVAASSTPGTNCQGWQSNDPSGGLGGSGGDALSLPGWTALVSPPFGCVSAFRLYCVQQ